MTESSKLPAFSGAHFLLTAACIVVVVAGLRAAADLVVQVLFAALLSIVCMPPIKRLERWGVPNAVSVVLVLSCVLLGLVWSTVMVGASVAAFREALPAYEKSLNDLAGKMQTWLSDTSGRDVSFQRYIETLEAGAILEFVGTTAVDAVAKIGNVIVVMLITLFVLLEAGGFAAKLRLAMDQPDNDLAPFRDAMSRVSSYLSIKAAVSLLTGGLAAAFLAIVGVGFPLLLGALAFVFNFVPNIGSIIAAVPAVLMALLEHGLTGALIVAAGYLVINLVIGNLVEPRILGQRLGLSTLVVFLSLIVWGWVLGPMGMLLSVPLTVVVKILLEHTRDFRGVAVLLGSAREKAPTRRD